MRAWTLIGVLGAGCHCGADPVRVEVETVLDGYAAAVRAGDVEAAWGRWSTARRRSETPELLVAPAWARNVDELGPLVTLRLDVDGLQPHDEPGHGPFLRVFTRWEGELHHAEVAFDLVDEGDGLRVDRTWSWPVEGVGTLRVF